MTIRNALIKILVGLGALALFGWLFAKTLRDVTSVPYTVRPSDLRSWSVELTTQVRPDGPFLLLQAPPELPLILVDQVFQRNMTSLTKPAVSGIPLILRHEFESVISSILSPEELVALARDAGLETATLQPLCMAVHRTPEQREQPVFYVLFDLPQFKDFREQVATVLSLRNKNDARFDVNALSPALFVAASEQVRHRVRPSPANLEAACETAVIPE
jgi:hypothetical protein